MQRPARSISAITRHLTLAMFLLTFAPNSQSQQPATIEQLVEQFSAAKIFTEQLEVARQIIALNDTSVLPALEPLLHHEDRHTRGNAAFVFAGLGDERGVAALEEVFHDHSYRPEGQYVGWGASGGKYHYELQVSSDRFYALYLFSQLKDPLTIPFLIDALNDPEFDYEALWALGQIGDERALVPMLNKLDDSDPTTRVHAIVALEQLKSKDALPRLRALLNDNEKSSILNQISVAEAARNAISTLEAEL